MPTNKQRNLSKRRKRLDAEWDLRALKVILLVPSRKPDDIFSRYYMGPPVFGIDSERRTKLGLELLGIKDGHKARKRLSAALKRQEQSCASSATQHSLSGVLTVSGMPTPLSLDSHTSPAVDATQ